MVNKQRTKNYEQEEVYSVHSTENWRLQKVQVWYVKDGERDVLDGVDLSSVSLEFIVPVTTSHSALLNDEDGDGGSGDGCDRGFHHINDIVFNAVEEDDDWVILSWSRFYIPPFKVGDISGMVYLFIEILANIHGKLQT